ncbi:hypothetical protein ANCDUO_16623, partial [Ancylostoma duodenale]
FIVGAPYAGKNKAGAVYVMHGSKDGVRQKYTQKVSQKAPAHRRLYFLDMERAQKQLETYNRILIQIEGASMGSRMKTFGFAVAGGVDVDGNGMPGELRP